MIDIETYDGGYLATEEYPARTDDRAPAPPVLALRCRIPASAPEPTGHLPSHGIGPSWEV
ncbi:hypothetical protein [Streptomyces sp. NPDC006997]|uniref:hypothetical protein n=1 Tax=Streptomyces sp. NPDC006997 TaxID=3155356 RepID=UPI0033E0B8DF